MSVTGRLSYCHNLLTLYAHPPDAKRAGTYLLPHDPVWKALQITTLHLLMVLDL